MRDDYSTHTAVLLNAMSSRPDLQTRLTDLLSGIEREPARAEFEKHAAMTDDHVEAMRLAGHTIHSYDQRLDFLQDRWRIAAGLMRANPRPLVRADVGFIEMAILHLQTRHADDADVRALVEYLETLQTLDPSIP